LLLGNHNETRLADLVAKYQTDPILKAIYTIGPRALYERRGTSPKSLREALLLRSPCGTCRLLFEDKDGMRALEDVSR
jgi:hypothetical protein